MKVANLLLTFSSAANTLIWRLSCSSFTLLHNRASFRSRKCMRFHCNKHIHQGSEPTGTNPIPSISSISSISTPANFNAVYYSQTKFASAFVCFEVSIFLYGERLYSSARSQLNGMITALEAPGV